MRSVLRLAFALPLVASLAASLAACSGAGPTTDTPASDTPAFQQTVAAGTPVFVNRQGQWIPATVVKQTGATNVLIHYEGMPAEWDEDVAFERVRSRPGAATPAAPGAVYKAGEVVLARSQNRIFVAEVVQQIDAQTYRVHYAGYGPEAVENVGMDRLQRGFAGATMYPAGTAVLVQAGAPQPLPGKVLAVLAADQWIVGLDGLGPQYHQQVGADRLQPLPATPAVTAPPVATAPPAVTAPPATTAPAATTKPAAGKPPVAAPAAPAAPVPLKAGDAVLVQVKTFYYPAKITAAGAAAGSWKVKLDGQSTEEEVAGDKVVRFQDPLKNVKYKAQQLVFVEWHGVYAPAKIIKEVDSGNYKVRIDGASPDADEIVIVKRLRPR